MIDNNKLLATYKESKKRYIDYFYEVCFDYVKGPNKGNEDIISFITSVGKMVELYDGMINDLEEDMHGKEESK